ncbi:MAG: polyprenyl synthetase family protein [Desulfobacterales bacterium]|nr:MAG: polyprenyl synthetase family protein [Desulfobacterales bacterium]
MTDLRHKIMAVVENDLEEIEQALLENLKPQLELVSDVARHILFSGGKRLRPLLMVLSAKICGYTGDYDKTFSTAFEYLHTATLLHDDLVDGATLRRGKAVAHSKWGNSITVLVGDFLLARALSIAAGTGSVQVIKILSELTENMSQGEVHQLMRRGDIGLSESEYLEVITRKTAVLFQAACRVSAILASAPAEKEIALSDFGYNLGIAFQMADDLFDYTLDTDSFGKEVGADLREGKLTLPVIYALQQAESQDREQMIRIIKNKDFSLQEFEQLIELLKKYGGLAYTEAKAGGFINRAKEALSIFKRSQTKETLQNIADYVLVRRI